MIYQHSYHRTTDSGVYSQSGRTSYRKISWSIEAARLDVNDRVALKFDRHFDTAAAEVKFQSDREILNPNLSALRFHEILRQDVRPLNTSMADWWYIKRQTYGRCVCYHTRVTLYTTYPNWTQPCNVNTRHQIPRLGGVSHFEWK